MEKVEKSNTNKLSSIFNGILFSFGITMISFLIFGIILSYTSISEDTINPVIIVITAVSILIGTSISCIKLEKNGLITGGIIGIIYIGLLYIISSALNNNFTLNTYHSAPVI
ncbi:MAG: TIGR04086 family membrane protein, partial [Clostridia bacterium]|nr:TIGR04086 family membrane protein [Clostridia bacterium]